MFLIDTKRQTIGQQCRVKIKCSVCSNPCSVHHIIAHSGNYTLFGDEYECICNPCTATCVNIALEDDGDHATGYDQCYFDILQLEAITQTESFGCWSENNVLLKSFSFFLAGGH